jgi:hypothetical protein
LLEVSLKVSETDLAGNLIPFINDVVPEFLILCCFYPFGEGCVLENLVLEGFLE